MMVSVLAISALSIIIPLGTAYAAKELIPQSATFNSINTASINPTIQHIAAKEITNAVNLSQAESGALIIADARTGKIVAFAEAGESIESNSWRSRIFNPASTMKPFIAAAAIDTGVATASTTYDCHGPYQVSGKQFKNSNPAIGKLSLADAIASSNNICMIKVAEATGAAKTRQILTRFGFDMNAAWDNKSSDELNLANTTIGSSIPVTLNSLTNAFTILANKGHLIQSNSSNAISEKTAMTVTKLLEKAVNDGTGKRAALTNVSVAGKTGTLSNDTYTSSLALFAGYAPSNSPRYISIVVIENARVKGSLLAANGGNVAAPVFHNTFDKILQIPNKA
jgi:cell division protein FtsI/penicillin-binding protein 2